jgi:membrane protein
MRIRKVTAVFLDIDGTLVDSNESHVSAWAAAFQENGHSIAPSAIRPQIGKGADMLIPHLVADIGDEEEQAIADTHDAIFKSRFLPRIVPFPRASEFIATLHKEGVRIVLASSASAAEVEHYVKLLAVEPFLAATTSADDVQHSKPARDIFASALEKVAPIQAPDTCAVGDTPYDVIAARKCGIPAIAVRSGGFPARDLKEAGAVAIYASVAELLTYLDSSPLAMGGMERFAQSR